VIIADIRKSPMMAESRHRDAYLRMGVMAMQTTPLLSRSGNTIGLLSTHWRRRGEPTARQLRSIDVLARQAADLIDRRNAEEALRNERLQLRDSEERFRLFMDNSPAIAWIKNEQGRYTFISNTALDRYNRGFEDVIGQTDADLFDPGTAEKLIRNDREAISTGHAVYYNEEVVDSGGRFLCWRNSKFPFQDSAGNRFVGGIGIEITELKEMEKALQESEEKFRSLFVHAQAAVLITVPDGTIEAANPAACAMFGYSEQELRDKGRSGILDGNDPRLRPALEERRRKGHVKALELTGVRKGGEKFPVEVDSVILPVGPARSFVIMRDITERKKAQEALRESESRLSAILNQLPIGVGVYGKDGQAVLCNDLMRSYMPGKIPSRDPEGRKRWRAVDSDGMPIPPEAWPGAQVLNGASALPGMELNCIDQQGRDLWLMVSAVPFANLKNGEMGAIMVAQDITDLKIAENALRESNQELNEYTYAVIHNVKAPFRAVQNYANFLIEDLGDSLNGEPRQFLDGINIALVQARHQFDDLDALYHIRKYEPEFETVDLVVLLNEIGKLHQTADDRRLIFPEHWPVVWAEIFLLRQILTELIANGFKYNRSEIKEVEVGWQLKHHQLVIFVRDNGIGIDPQYHEHIFHIFKRLHTENEYDGTGIGLAIVRRAVKKIGGEVSIRSAAGDGSTFFISLPAGKAATST
jgi:PAS domain S-box-containing protein